MASGAKYNIQEQLVMAFFGYWAFPFRFIREKDLIEMQRLLNLEKHKKKLSAVEMGYVIYFVFNVPAKLTTS